MKNKIKHIDGEYKTYMTSYKTVKTSLSKIVKNNKIHEDINNVVKRVNIVTTHTYNFFKLYCLY